MKKLIKKRTIYELAMDFPSIDSLMLNSIKGGDESYSSQKATCPQTQDWWNGYGSQGNPIYLNGVTITPTGGYVNYPSSSTNPGYSGPWGGFIGGSSGSNYGYGNGGGGGGGGGSSSTSNGTLPDWVGTLDTALGATGTGISLGMAFVEVHGIMDSARLGNLNTDAKSILTSIFETSPTKLWDDVKGIINFNDIKGIALIDKAGRALGVVGAVESAVTLTNDILDGDGHVSTVNIVDFAVNVGSIAIKSNVVGVAVSLGWLIIKAEIEDQTPPTEPSTYGGYTGADPNQGLGHNPY